MPWTIRDVDEHIGGLSDSQKREWVRIANNVLARCLQRKKEAQPEGGCEGYAIRVANSRVNGGEQDAAAS